MGVVRKQAFDNLIVSYIGIAIGYLNLAIIFPRLLSQEVFGLTQVLMAAMLFASNLGSFGLQFIVIRFFHIFKTLQISTRTFFSVGLLISMVGILLTSLVLLIFSTNIKAAYMAKAALFPNYYYLMFPLVIFGILSVLLDSYSRAVLKSVLTAVYKEVLLRIFQLVIVVGYYYEVYDLDRFIMIFTALQGLYVVAMYFSLVRFSDIIPTLNFRGVNKDLIEDVVKYGGVSMLSVTVLLANNVDVLIVGSMVGLEATAIYSVASAVCRMITVPSRSMNRVAISLIAEAWAKSDVKKVGSIYSKSAITSLIIGGAIFLGIILNLPLLLSVLPQNYQDAETIVLFLSFAKLIQMGTGINAGVIVASKDYWMNMLSNVLSFVLLIGLSYLLINVYGIIGAAYAAILAEGAANFARFLFLKIKYGMQPFTKAYFGVLALGTVVYVAHIILPNASNMFIDSAIRTSLGLGGFLGLVHYFRYSNDFSEIFDITLRRLKSLAK